MTCLFSLYNEYLCFLKDFLRMLISRHIADIVTFAIDRPGVHLGLFTQPSGQIARGIIAATLIDRFLDEGKIFFFIIVKWWNGPAGRRILRLFVHRDGTHIFIGLQDTRFLQSSQRW